MARMSAREFIQLFRFNFPNVNITDATISQMYMDVGSKQLIDLINASTEPGRGYKHFQSGLTKLYSGETRLASGRTIRSTTPHGQRVSTTFPIANREVFQDSTQSFDEVWSELLDRTKGLGTSSGKRAGRLARGEARIATNERILPAFLGLPQEMKQVLATAYGSDNPATAGRVRHLEHLVSRHYEQQASLLVTKRRQLADVKAQVDELNGSLGRRPRNFIEREQRKANLGRISSLRDLMSSRYREQSVTQQAFTEAEKSLQLLQGDQTAWGLTNIQEPYRKPSLQGGRMDRLHRLSEQIAEGNVPAYVLAEQTRDDLLVAERNKLSRSMTNVDRNFSRLFASGAIPAHYSGESLYGPAFIAPSGVFRGAHVSILPVFDGAEAMPSVRLQARNLVDENVMPHIRFSAPRRALDHRGAMGRQLHAYSRYGQGFLGKQRISDSIIGDYESGYMERAVSSTGFQMTARMRRHFQSRGVSFADEDKVMVSSLPRNAQAQIRRYMPGTSSLTPGELAEELYAGALIGKPPGRFGAFKDINPRKYINILMGASNRRLSPFETQVREALLQAAPGLNDILLAQTEAGLRGERFSIKDYQIRVALQEGVTGRAEVPVSGSAYERVIRGEVSNIRGEMVGKDYPVSLMYEGSSAFGFEDVGRPYEDVIDSVSHQQDLDRLLKRRAEMRATNTTGIPSPGEAELDKEISYMRRGRQKELRSRRLGLELRNKQQNLSAIQGQILAEEEGLRLNPGDEVAKQRLGNLRMQERTAQNGVSEARLNIKNMSSSLERYSGREADSRLNSLRRFYGLNDRQFGDLRNTVLGSQEGYLEGSFNPFFGTSRGKSLIDLQALASSQTEIEMSLPGLSGEPVTASAIINHVQSGGEGAPGRLAVGYTLTGSEQQREEAWKAMYGGQMLQGGASMDEVGARAVAEVANGWNQQILEYDWHSIAPDPAEMTAQQLRARARRLGVPGAEDMSRDQLARAVPEELHPEVRQAISNMSYFGEWRPVADGAGTELSQSTQSLATFGIRGQNMFLEEAAQLPPNSELAKVFEHNRLIAAHVTRFMSKEGGANANRLITEVSSARQGVGFIPSGHRAAFQDVFQSIGRNLQKDYGIDWGYAEDLSRNMREGIPLNDAAREIFSPRAELDMAQIGVEEGYGNLTAPLSPWARVYRPGEDAYMPMGEMVLQSKLRHSSKGFRDIMSQFGTSQRNYDKDISDAIAGHMQKMLSPEVWRILGQTERGQQLQKSLITHLPEMGQAVSDVGQLPEHLKAAYFENVLAPAIGSMSGRPGTTVREGAKGTAAAEEILAGAKRPLKAVVTPVANLLRENRMLRYGAYGIAALGALGVIRAGMKHHQKDRTKDDMQGPPHLPGGNPYSGTLPSGQTYNAVGLPGYQPNGGSFTGNGMTYQVNARGSFDPAVIQAQIESITGANAYGNIYSAPSMGESRDPSDIMRNY